MAQSFECEADAAFGQEMVNEPEMIAQVRRKPLVCPRFETRGCRRSMAGGDDPGFWCCKT